MAQIRVWQVKNYKASQLLEKVLNGHKDIKNLDIIDEGYIMNVTTVNDDKDTPGTIDVVVNMATMTL